ncbi:hypothetical protein AB6806_14905 [Bosea sp. RCC_152_1]|uniref:hypothetical protein n=1 Tax=Bosea sp. RCC_152_1 TaxID=3239228 RepID=UPI0035237DAF
MSGFQFAHLEVYGRKPDAKGRSVNWVLAEATREPDACPHVATPTPPELVHGIALSEVRRLHDEACSTAKVTLSNGRLRAISKDQKTLLTVVTSHPALTESVRSDPALAAEVRAWEKRSVTWLREQYGERLLSVVRHVDESYAHLHAYVLPSDLKAAGLHPGTAAKRAVTSAGPAEGEDPKALNRRGDAAYRQAMREWQDSYWVKVGLPSGLARLGPGRRRLTREQWQAERMAARSTKMALDQAVLIDRKSREQAAKVKAAITDAQARTESAKALHDAAVDKEREASTALDRAGHQEMAAKALQAAAEVREQKASATLARAGGEAERIIAKAAQQASRISSWGSRLRSFLDGLRKSSIAAAARLEAAREVARERARADDAARRALEEAARRREAERRAQAATESVLTTARERDQARQELAALRPAPPALDMGRRFGR